MATSLTETATTAKTNAAESRTTTVDLQPPPGIMPTASSCAGTNASPSKQQRTMAIRTTPSRNSPFKNSNGSPNNGGGPVNGGIASTLGMGGSTTGFIRRATSADDNLSNSEFSRHSNANQFYPLHPSSPWSTFNDIFRANDDEARQPSRHETSGRLRSHDMDPMLGVDFDDDEEEERQPQDRLGGHERAIFRQNKLYSPIIGTPPRWASGTGNSNDAADLSEDLAWIPAIRPSLSCPTTMFESPLFPSSGSNNALNALGGGGLGMSGTRPTALLSQPYRLEKIISASAQSSPSHGSDENGLASEDENGLENVDVSVIECDNDDSPFRVQNDAIERVNPHSHNHDDSHNSTRVDDNNPMRNLSGAFEMLVVDGVSPTPNHSKMETVQNLERHLENHNVPQSRNEMDFKCDSSLSITDRSKSGDTNSTTKPSPTSVLGYESESVSGVEHSAVNTMQLENGLTVANISMPHFHIHDSLRGSLCQGLVDRVSFYSVVRDINKEASDAAATDPRGGVYNDGTVHGKQSNAGAAKSATTTNTVTPLPPANGKHQVVAEDGKVHVHPNPKEEKKSVLVMACLADERKTNPNEGPSTCTVEGQGNAPACSAPSLGAALLDEEWWLMSAIASRTAEEVVANQSSKLLPTFYEAVGEKDANVPPTTAASIDCASTGQQSTGQSSRTQLWKPGRSWWEAKSGKNPWVEPVVHNNRWRYLWPLIHYHKFIAKCIKKLKRNSIDVKQCPSNVSLFLRQEVCNVSDHLAFMSKYDSEEWTSALSHFVGWTDHDPTVEETLRTLVASQRLAGVADTADTQSSLLRSQIDDQILRAMQAAKEEAGKDAYDYKDAPKEEMTATTAGGFSQHPSCSRDNSFGNRTAAWANESHLRSAIESKKRTINDTSWSDRSGYHAPHPPHPQEMYARQFVDHPPYGPANGYNQPYGGPMNQPYYPQHPHQQYDAYHRQYPPHHPMGYQYNEQYGHPPQYYNGYYHPADGSFHEGMVFDNSMHAQDPYLHASSMMHTPSRYQGGDIQHQGQYPASPYWEHLHISQLPGIAASPSIHVTPSKPPRGHPNRSFRKHQQHQQGPQGRPIDGKAKSLIMFPNQTNSPASRFVMSPQDKTNPYYTSKNSQPMAPNDKVPAASSSALNQSVAQDESFILPTIEDYSPESPADKTAGHTSLHSNTSLDLMPPTVKKMYMGSRRQDGTLSEVSENS